MNPRILQATVGLSLQCLWAAVLPAQTVLSSFDAAPAEVGGSWASNTTLSGGILTIGGTAQNDGAFFYANPVANWASFSAVAITARVDDGNTATNFSFYFDTDSGLTAHSIVLSTASFGPSFTTVTVPLTFGPVPPSAIEAWGIVTQAIPDAAFRMSFDQIALVPEPATYALLLALGTLGLVAWRRFRR